jgi:hypothetical protein
MDDYQELRDIVIETRTDVKHILKSLEKGDTEFQEIKGRIDVLESCEDERRGTLKSAGMIATAISSFGAAISVLYTFFHGGV